MAFDVRGRLPTADERNAITAAVTHVVQEVLLDDMLAYADRLAAVGAAVASAALDRNYVLAAGSFCLFAGPDGSHWALDASDGGFARGEYCAWLTYDHGHGRTELVDLATHLWPMLTAQNGLRWHWPDPVPSAAWGWLHEISPQGARYAADPATTRALLTWRDQNACVLETLTARAIARLPEPLRSIARARRGGGRTGVLQ